MYVILTSQFFFSNFLKGLISRLRVKPARRFKVSTKNSPRTSLSPKNKFVGIECNASHPKRLFIGNLQLFRRCQELFVLYVFLEAYSFPFDILFVFVLIHKIISSLPFLLRSTS